VAIQGVAHLEEENQDWVKGTLGLKGEEEIGD